MPAAAQSPPMILPRSVADALAALALPGAQPVAGASWVMRAPLRHEPQAPTWVALAGIEDLHRCDTAGDRIRLGALVTHDRLAHALPAAPDLRALAQAAAGAANPGVRRIATLGGNLCATGFAAADLAPALLALDATVEIATPQGRESLPVADFLTRRGAPGPWLLTEVTLPRGPWHSAHARLPMRKAGDYPAAIVSLSATLSPEGRIERLRAAIGAVEQAPRRWHALETRAKGEPLAALADLAQDTAGITPREALDAPGWYRLRILPTLVRRAAEAIAEGTA